MSLPSDYNKAIRTVGGFYAAWFPVTDPYRIGDFGLIQDGVFRKIGHLDDMRYQGFNVPIKTAPGNPGPLDLVTEGVKTIKTAAGAEGPIPNFPAGEVSATLTYQFQKSNSFVVKSAEMSVEQMENIQQVAEELARLRWDGKWTHRYRVVSSVYSGKDCLVLLASHENTKVSFEGTASALRLLDAGKADLKQTISEASDTVLKRVGNSGALGLKLFKLKLISGDLKLLREKELKAGETAVEDDWGDKLENDLD